MFVVVIPCSCFCVGLFLLCVYCGHVFYLSIIRFDYGYNMKFNVTIGEIYRIKLLVIVFLMQLI